jgi:CDP-diacylglycerol---glycerol-3-phosphate 3-phosphatidyltransferase
MAEQDSQPKSSYFTIANGLTLARLILLPFIIVGVVTENGWLAVITMGIVLLTDLLDGRIARRLNQASVFGKTLDSTIDFVLIYSLFIAFYAAGRLALWQFGILYFALLTTLLFQLAGMAEGGEGVLRSRSGKLTGALQYGYLLFLVVREVLPEGPAVDLINIIFFVALTAAIGVSSVVALIKLAKMTQSSDSGD